MSELDLGSTAAPTATAGRAGDAPAALVLTPPAPVASSSRSRPPAPSRSSRRQAGRAAGQGRRLRDELAALDTGRRSSPRRSSRSRRMGDREMRASAAVSSRMLDRPAAASCGKGKGGGDAQTRVASTLVDLRLTITDLDPNRADLTGIKKVLKWIPGGDKIDRYFAKYQSAQSHLDAIIRALASGKDELGKDNAAIETEKANMWTMMGKLGEYNELAAALDEAVEDKVADAGGRRAAPRTPNTLRVRRAVPDPAAAAGHHDADGRRRAGLHGARPGPQEQPGADAGRRPGADHDDRRAAHRGHRVAGAGPAEAGARPDHRAEHGHRRT